MASGTETQRSLTELFAAATDWTQEGGEGDWSAVVALHHLGSQKVLDRAVALTSSEDPRERARGADILGQLGVPEHSFPDRCIEVVTELLERDAHPLVLSSAAVALGHLDGKTEPLLRHVGHADCNVRYGVAWALGGRWDPEAVAALIRLTEDEDSDVRDWATFGLGAIGQVNSPEVREALFRRLDDEDCDTQFEAVCGLARCRDGRVAVPLRDALAEDPGNDYLQEAAARLLGFEDEFYEDNRDTRFPPDRLIDLLDKHIASS